MRGRLCTVDVCCEDLKQGREDYRHADVLPGVYIDVVQDLAVLGLEFGLNSGKHTCAVC